MQHFEHVCCIWHKLHIVNVKRPRQIYIIEFASLKLEKTAQFERRLIKYKSTHRFLPVKKKLALLVSCIWCRLKWDKLVLVIL